MIAPTLYNFGMEIFGIGLTFFAGILTYLAWTNGKWMKETLRGQNKLLEKMNETLRYQTEMLKNQSETLRYQTEILYKIGETLKIMEKNAEQRHMEVLEMIKTLK